MSQDQEYPRILLQAYGYVHLVSQEDVYKFLDTLWRQTLLPELVVYFGRMFSYPSDLITQSQAARLKKCSVKTIQYHIKRATLPTYTEHRLVNRHEVEKLELRKDAGKRRAPYNRKPVSLPEIEARDGLPYFPKSISDLQ